jgi:hypothetical protein
LPERNTVRGFFTRVLPHRLHIWYYRYICGVRWAGQPGHGPYPTSYHPVIGRERLCVFLMERGVQGLSCYGDGFNKFRSETSRRVVSIALNAVSKVVSMLSFGQLNGDYTEVLYIGTKSVAN